MKLNGNKTVLIERQYVFDIDFKTPLEAEYGVWPSRSFLFFSSHF